MLTVSEADVTNDAGVKPVVTRRDRRTRVSRIRILDAAVQCLVEDGYSRASTLAIQRRAEVTRGRLLHHFPSRDALLVAAAQHLAIRHVAEAARMAERFVQPDGSAARIEEAVSTMWDRYQEPYFRAATELWTAAVHNDDLRAALGPAEARLNATIRPAVAAMFGPTHAEHPTFGALSDMLLTSMRGVAVGAAFEGRERRHRRHVEGWIRVARAVLMP
jgi:AcrR family transcriptional regulator